VAHVSPLQLWRLHSVSLSGDRHHRKKPKSEKGRIPPMANPRLPQKQAPELRNKSPELRINRQITRVKEMTKQDLKLMSVDELWSLHELVTLALARKIANEQSRLDHRLRQLGLSASGNAKNLSASGSAKKLNHARRPYPQVFPKYRNPAQPAETWAGRGKQPRWLTAQLRSGKKLDDFRIQPASGRARRSAR
jgi:DNA-binding protein H-NS